MQLSYSKVATFRRCGLQYRARYLARVPSKPRPPLKLANALHVALEHFHDRYVKPLGLLGSAQQRLEREVRATVEAETEVLGREATGLDYLLAYYDRCWQKPLGPHDARQYEEGRRALEVYYEQHGRAFSRQLLLDELTRRPRPVLVEERFQVPLGRGRFGEELVLVGKLDRVDRLPDGQVEIVDYKTQKEVPPLEAVDVFQLEAYQLGLYELTGEVATLLSYHYLLHDRKVGVTRWPDTLQRTRATLEEAARHMDAAQRGAPEALRPTPGRWCATCAYVAYCPAKAANPLAFPDDGAPRQMFLPLDGSPTTPPGSS